MSTLRILFLISFFIGCTPSKQEVVALRWQDEKATGILIPKSFLKVSTSLQNRLTVQLIQPGERSAILGEIKSENDLIIFEPLVPLTRGLRYEVLFDNNLIAEIEVPKSESEAPVLLGIYPSQDTVPENLLKMYFQFSQPMVEDRSLSFITIMNHDDTLNGIFLDLKPELWNKEGTVLTLWLDPGRIKRDLIPNKELGNPLKAGEKYTLHVSSGWASKEGTQLTTTYSKTFITTSRDEQIPAPDLWDLTTPKSGTAEPLKIDLIESLDYSLLMESVQVMDSDKKLVSGKIQLVNEERIFHFTPDNSWKPGEYTIVVESRLEDLAGNNLNRPFDRDVTAKKKEDQEVFKRVFIIR